MTANTSKLLQVALSEGEKRHIESLAASEGLILRQAPLRRSKPGRKSCNRAPCLLTQRGGAPGAPVAEIFQSVADGHPLVEIAEVFELTLQLIAVLQFAAEGAAPAAPGRD